MKQYDSHNSNKDHSNYDIISIKNRQDINCNTSRPDILDDVKSNFYDDTSNTEDSDSPTCFLTISIIDYSISNESSFSYYKIIDKNTRHDMLWLR